ncbi:MAG: hypothetical protein ABI068_09975 [Ktedonobacterales bacterium]
MICSRCGAENPPNADACAQCGLPLAASAIPSSPSSAQSDSAASGSAPGSSPSQPGQFVSPPPPAEQPALPVAQPAAHLEYLSPAGEPQLVAPQPPVYPTPPYPPAAYPGYAGYPSAPSQPFYAEYPGYPSYLPYGPAQPSQPLAPGSVEATGQPGAANPPTYPNYPGYPGYPPSGYPASGAYPYPGFAGYPTYAGAPVAPATAPSQPFATSIGPRPKRPPSPFARKFPLWLTLLIGVGVVVLLAAVFGLSDLTNGNDLGGAAAKMGATALALAVVSLVVWLVRVGLGRRASVAITLGLLLVALTASVGVGGLVGANPIRQAQAQSLEKHGQWQGAITLYQLAGEHGASAHDIARVYAEWGEALLAQHQYADAASRFTTVITVYTRSGADVTSRAKRGLFNTYVAWLGAGGNGAPLKDIIGYLENFQNSVLCDTACQTTFTDADAHAYYLYALQLYQHSDLVGAATAFDSLRLLYPAGSYVQQGHAVEAQVYYAYAQQQLSTACESALPLYQTLATAYADTPEGHKAKSLLQRPVDVYGSLVNYPKNVRMVMYLSRNAHVPAESNPPISSIYFSQNYSTVLNSATGTFHFSGVTPGTYALSDNDGVSIAWWIHNNNSLYFFQVGQLCPTTFDVLSDSTQQHD